MKSESSSVTIQSQTGAAADRLAVSRREQVSIGEATALSRAFARATRTPHDRMAAELQNVLSRQLLAYMVGAKDPKTIARWAGDSSVVIRDPAMLRRLQAVYQIVI